MWGLHQKIKELEQENKRLRTALEEAMGALDTVADVRDLPGFQVKLNGRWMMTDDAIKRLRGLLTNSPTT